MKKIYHYLIAAVAVTVLGLTLGACEELPQDGADAKEVVAGGYDSEVYARKVNIGKHEYYVVYVSCNGRPGHSVHQCNLDHGGNGIHCFLRHSLDCPCRKVEPSASVTATDDAEDTESTDPFDW